MSGTRPRQHVLETESKRAFDALMPSEWIVRHQDAGDYGIDAEVEIFSDEEPTGLTFKVQLKATDDPGDTGRRRQIKTKTLAYWASLDVPVLVVYYEAATGNLYGRWAHGHGLLLSETPREEAKTTTFRFEDSHRLHPRNCAQLLEADVRRLREFRRLGAPQPVSYDVQATGLEPGIESSLLGAVRKAFDSSPVDFRLSRSEPFLRIEVGPSSFRLRLPIDVGSFTWHGPGNDWIAAMVSDPEALEVLAADVLAATAFTLATAGAFRPAADIVVAVGLGSTLTQTMEFVTFASAILAHEARYQESFAMGFDLLLDDDPDMRWIGSMFVLPPTLFAGAGELTVSPSELREVLQRKIELDLAQELRLQAGIGYYNLAQSFRGSRLYADAASAFENAPGLEPDYLSRDYYFRERGGTYFDSGRHDLAVADYERARELGFAEEEILPLLADALLHSGRFAAAVELWSGWEPRETRYDRMMGVVGLAAATVIDVTGLHEQRRRPLTEDEIASIGEPPDPDICRQLLHTADALSPQLWLDILPTLPEESAFGGLVLAAHVAVDRPDLWALASLIAAEGAPDSPITRQLIDSGSHLCGGEYLEVVRSLVGAASSDGVLSPEQLAVIEHRIATRPDDRIEPVLRMHGDEDAPQAQADRGGSAFKRKKSRKMQKQSRRKNR